MVQSVDKSTLALPEPWRVRDRVHVKNIAAQAGLICGWQPWDAHHQRFARVRAYGSRGRDLNCRAAIQAIERQQDLARLAPKSCFISALGFGRLVEGVELPCNASAAMAAVL